MWIVYFNHNINNNETTKIVQLKSEYVIIVLQEFIIHS